MKKVSCLAIVGMFILSIALIGCGNLKKQEFDSIFTEYQSEQETIHGELNAKMTGIDQKLDQEISDRKTSVDEAMNEAKNDAMAAAEQGDADTLDAAKSEDDKVRQDAKRLAQEAEENAKKFAQSEAEKVRGQAEQAAREAMNAANSAAGTANRAVTDIAALRGEMQKIKPPITVAVVNFASGRAALTAEAKASLDAAVNDIKMYGNAPVMVKGHADGNPVLRGRYQSNWDLSQDRANAVVKYLQEKGVDNPIEAVARAHTEPVAPAFTRDGRAKNRRAEVIVYPSGTVE
jgi:flagellar motor protein MotB